MATGSLQVNRDIILATKRQHLKQQKENLPTEAVLSMAQMQTRPRSLLNYASDNHDIKVLAQVTLRDVFDPISSALHCIHYGADGIAFFTDHALYDNDLDDLLLVSRAVGNVPVLYQNYIFDEYGVMLARSSDASAVIAYASILPDAEVRKVISMAQRWKMSTFVQVDNLDDLNLAIELSPHAICFGDIHSDIEQTSLVLQDVRDKLPPHLSLMLMQSLTTLADVEHALRAPVDAILVDEMLLKNEREANAIREMVAEAEKERAS